MGSTSPSGRAGVRAAGRTGCVRPRGPYARVPVPGGSIPPGQPSGLGCGDGSGTGSGSGPGGRGTGDGSGVGGTGSGGPGTGSGTGPGPGLGGVGPPGSCACGCRSTEDLLDRRCGACRGRSARGGSPGPRTRVWPGYRRGARRIGQGPRAEMTRLRGRGTGRGRPTVPS
ncbi:hypothetical protein C3486_15565 [Streptomyces sp. Ru73]|nr:hypothetical protein C3486_15565 [Streptomyces sp. Ru73]